MKTQSLLAVALLAFVVGFLLSRESRNKGSSPEPSGVEWQCKGDIESMIDETKLPSCKSSVDVGKYAYADDSNRDTNDYACVCTFKPTTMDIKPIPSLEPNNIKLYFRAPEPIRQFPLRIYDDKTTPIAFFTFYDPGTKTMPEGATGMWTDNTGKTKCAIDGKPANLQQCADLIMKILNKE